MKKIYRFVHNTDYWNNRWTSSGVDNRSFQKFDFYPVKQAESLLEEYNSAQKILELGCGAGRVFFHYQNKKYNIDGIEYSQVAVNNIQKVLDDKTRVIQGNVLDLPYMDKTYDYILAFGLFHNLEDINDIQRAFNESSRILKPGGKLLFSVRFDSFENNLIEKIIRTRNKDKQFIQFHRWHFDLTNTRQMLLQCGLHILNIEYSRNVSFLFKYDVFRSKNMKKSNFNESIARSQGFKLNTVGQCIDLFLHKYFPKKFSNLLIITTEKA